MNLASDEYFKSVKPKKLQATVITPVFQDLKNGQYKIISFYAKRARGLMARWAVEHAVTDAEALKAFNSEGYAFDCQCLRRHALGIPPRPAGAINPVAANKKVGRGQPCRLRTK